MFKSAFPFVFKPNAATFTTTTPRPTPIVTSILPVVAPRHNNELHVDTRGDLSSAAQ
jgi:hypothetical protein